MKKVIWGGFCLLSGILLFWMMSTISFSIDNGAIDALLELFLKILAIALGVYGLVLGFTGLKKD